MGSAGGSLGAGVRERLLDQLERIYRQHILPRYSRVLEGRDPDGVVAV